MLARIVFPEASLTPVAAAALDKDRLDFLAVAHVAALRLDELDKARDERARAAHREMHAPALLQEWDQAIDRAGAERIAADQQRMEAEDRPQPLVAEISRHEAVDAAMAPEPHEIAGDARHVERSS